MVFYQILKNGGACPHQNGWLWFEVCLVLSSGHWRSDLAKVSDEAGKTQIPLDFFSPWESHFLTFSAVLEYHCLWQHECVLLYWESPPIIARPTVICCSQHLDTVLVFLVALL